MATWSTDERQTRSGKALAIPESGGREAGAWAIRNGLAVGSLASLIASGVMLWVGREWGGSIVAQLIAERTTAELPLAVVRDTLERLEENAKPAALLGITLGQVIAAALLAVLYSRYAGAGATRRLVGVGGLAAITWATLSFVAAPLGGIGVLALDSPLGTGDTQLGFVIVSLVYAGIVAAMVPWPVLGIDEVDADRRSVLRIVSLGALAIPALWAARYVGSHANRIRTSAELDAGFREAAGDGPFEFAGMPEFYTPLDAFYVVSKNLVDPSVSSVGWSLEVDGMVDDPLSLSYSDILDRPSQEMAATLECISNRVGGGFISNTVWTGFPLRELLDEARLQPGVVDIKLEAADGYTESIPLAEAMQEDTLLVHLMDGAPLTESHGYPLRLIVPGIFGMKNIKWITRIEAVAEDFQGYWQERAWSDVATVVTMSRIDTPSRGYKARLGETVSIGGVAFAGDRGISKVEVSVDDGQTWNDAQLSDVPSDRTWRLWRYDYLANEPGIRKVAVRATDGDGVTQTSEERDPLPDGATGYDRDWFEVLEEV